MPATLHLVLEAERVADAFGLAQPVGGLVPVRHGDRRTWRLDASSGSYLVKQLCEPGSEPDWPLLQRSMALEQSAIDSGIRTAVPVEPARPVIGYATLVDGLGYVRAYGWLPHRTVAPTDDISAWLGVTLARLHTLAPVPDPAEPSWPLLGVWPRDTWAAWVRRAELEDAPWAGIARRRLPEVNALTELLREIYAGVPDQVLTHGDLEPNNVLLTDRGPVLIDWETVWPYSAALQAGRVALAFGEGRAERMRAILRAYVAAGGSIEWVGRHLLLSTLSHELATIADRIRAVFGVRPVPRWLSLGTAGDRIGRQLHGLPDLAHRLSELALVAIRQNG